MKKILFVCHGNICRSPMAEFVMRELVKRAGLSQKIEVASAACRRDELGADTYQGTKAVLREKGIPFTKRQAVLITPEDFEYYDFIIAMDHENLFDLQRLNKGRISSKVRLLMECAGEKRDVADPWYTDDFETTYDDVLRGCTGLLEQLAD